jgi:hypothetical protein
MKRFALIILTNISYFFYLSPIFAMQYGHDHHPISMAMGNSTTCISSHYLGTDIASMALHSASSVQVYAQNKATLPQLGLYNVAMVYSNQYVNVGLKGFFHGFESYNEYSVQASFGHFFKPYIAISIQAEYTGLYQSPKEKYLHSGCLSLGMQVFPFKNMRVGFSVYNASFSAFKTETESIRLPVIFRLGMGYHIAQKVLLTAEVHKAIDQPFAYSIGLDYQVIKALALRTGMYVCHGITPSLGIGLTIKKCRIDIGMQYHFNTGLNTAVGIIYLWNE